MSPRVTLATVRSLALAMPGVEEDSHYGISAFKLNGRMMACPAQNKSADPNTLVVKIDDASRDELIESAPETYYITSHYLNYNAVLVRLSKISRDALKDLLQMSWTFIGAKRPTKKGITPKRRNADR